MNDIDPCTVTTEDLAAMLRVWTSGLYTSEAAVELLIGHRSWLRRADFLHACVEVVEDGFFNGREVPMAAIDWREARAGLDDGVFGGSSTDLQILRLAISMSGDYTPPDPTSLGELIPGLDARNTSLVLESIAHLAGWHEQHQARRVTGELPATTTALRLTATAEDETGQPLERDTYANLLRREMTQSAGHDRQTGASRKNQRWQLLSAAEGAVVAELLDELAGVWTNELLGLLAREMAVRLYDRIGV